MTHIDRRRVLRMFGALGALGPAGLATACSTGSGAGNAEVTAGSPIRIGLLAPRGGSLRAIGEEIVNGFQLYLTLNNGQLGGHPVTVLSEDEGTTAETGKAALDRLLRQDVLALAGVASAEVMLAVRDTVESAQVPLIGANASPATLQGVIYIWRTSYVGTEPGRALGAYLSREFDGRIALVAPDDTDGNDAIDGFVAGFGESDARISASPILIDRRTAPGPSSFGPQLRRIRDMDADAVYCFFAGTAAVEFVKQFADARLRIPIYAPGFLTEGAAALQALQTVRNPPEIYTAMNYSTDLDNAANRLFTREYRREYGALATAYAMASYDAAAVLDNAIRLAGDTMTPQRINLMLGKVGQIDSPRGTWQFNQGRTPLQKWYLRRVRRDGQVLANVSLSELATLG